MNLGDAVQELADRGFDSLTPARATRYLSAAKDTLEACYSWPHLRTSATGVSPLVIADLRTILWVRNSAGCQLPVLDEGYIAAQGLNFNQTGTAEYVWIEGDNTVRTWPVDSSTSLTVGYVKFSPALAVDADEPTWPALDTRWDFAWIDFACVEAYRDSDAHDQADRLLAAADRRAAQLIESYAGRQLQNPDYQVVHGFGLDQ